jgi:hypothetical protein
MMNAKILFALCLVVLISLCIVGSYGQGKQEMQLTPTRVTDPVVIKVCA